MQLDEVVECWCKGSKSGDFKYKTQSLISGLIGASSASSTVSKKREKVALAQLKVNQLMKRQEMKRRLAELRYQEELMEAQMEEEQAMVSYNIYNEQNCVNEGVENSNEEHCINLSANNEPDGCKAEVHRSKKGIIQWGLDQWYVWQIK